MKNRSRMDIAVDMLKAATGGSAKTAIMYNSSLSFPQLKEYLELLHGSGLVEYSDGEGKYYTTEKGRQFVERYDKIRRMMFPKEKPRADGSSVASRAHGRRP